VVITDVRQDRLKVAKELGANACVTVGQGLEADIAAVKGNFKDTEGWADVSIECCGFESATRTAIACTASGIFVLPSVNIM